ncbi:hypothetical protein ACFY40_17680 [Streptomyces sp. NPDC012950]|uniref:hypothetical protein n=1 Tax=Streptomyces sp. NPDC012950 TaxID=3364858 RepID=UPI00368B5E70
MNFLLVRVCGLLAGGAPVLWAAVRGRVLRRAVLGGRAVGVPAEVARRAEDGAPAVRGDLWLPGRAGVPVHFVAEDSTVLAVPRGGRVKDVVPLGTGGFRRQSFVRHGAVVYEVPGTGDVLTITVDRPAAEVVTRALTARGDTGAGDDGLRPAWWHLVRVPCLAALLLSGAFVLGLVGAHTFGLGREVTAEVTGTKGGMCRVVWQDPWDPSLTRHARVDCYEGEKAGDPLRIGARPWPMRGEAADLDVLYVTAFGASVLGVAGAGGVLLASWTGARRLRLLREHLRSGGGSVPGRAAGRVVVPRWSWAAGALGLAGLGLLTLAYGFGQPVRAEVTAATEYGCAVAWADPWDGVRHTAEVDCGEEARGDLLEISALPWPLRGEAFDRDFTPFVLGIPTALAVGAALLGVVLRSRRARGTRPLVLTAVAAPDAPAGPAGETDDPGDVLDRPRLAALARLLHERHALAGGAGKHRPEPDPAAGPWWRSPVLRRVVLASGVAWGALFVLAVTALWSGWWWGTAYRQAVDRTERATATVQYLHEEFPLEPWPLPGAVEVRFDTEDGRRVVTDVEYGDPAPAEGDAVEVEYAVGRPSAARIAGDPGLGRGLWASGAVAAAALVRLVWCAVSTGRVLRRLLRAARQGEARDFDYLLLPPSGEEPEDRTFLLVLFAPGASRPTATMDAVPAAASLPPEGTLEMRALPEAPAFAVAWTAGRPVWPSGPLVLLEEGEEDDEEEFLRQYVTSLVPPGVALDVPPRPRLTSPTAGA